MNSNTIVILIVLTVIGILVRIVVAIVQMRRTPRPRVASGFWEGCLVGLLMGVLLMAAIILFYPTLAARFR